MRTSTSNTITQVLTDDEDREFELPIADRIYDPSDTALVGTMADGRMVVSYLVCDDSCSTENPAEEDCSGWQEFMVLRSQRDADILSERLNTCDQCGEYFDIHTLEYFDEADLHEPVSARRTAIAAKRAFMFEKYEHGLVNYALRGESSAVDREWDVSPVAGFMWADDDWGDDVDMVEAARGFLRTYTAWCNGEVYGVVHAFYVRRHGEWIIDEADTDDCWGFIGHEHAEAEMKAGHEHYLKVNDET